MRVYQFRHIRAGTHSSRPLATGLRHSSDARRYLGGDGFSPPDRVVAVGRLDSVIFANLYPPLGCFFAGPRSIGRALKVSLLVTACFLAFLATGSAAAREAGSPLTEVIVTLSSPPLASAPSSMASTAKAHTLNLRSVSSVRYLERLASEQDAVARRIEASIPQAQVRWRYRIVANGLAVALPGGEVARLARVPGVARVESSHRYVQLQSTPPANVSVIGAPALWGSGLANAGQGVKIAIIDDGIDQTQPYFDPTGYTMPAGYPKGDTAFTTAKVIAARAFPPPGLTGKNVSPLPFDSGYSSHGTYVAGIAAGKADTTAIVGDVPRTLSGVAPFAYLANYKALTIPTESFGLNGNSPEIVAAIEAAVSDGMNVINLSIGEPEIDPRNDIVAKAVNAASAAGVVVVAAAGNEYLENGKGSVSSPGSAAGAITVAASSSATSGKIRIASFSSAGPTPYGLLLKPDVSAPGIDILSSAPAREGFWSVASGTSAASPHVAGAAALLRQRHPAWTVAQIKSALILTAEPVTNASGRELSPLQEGGGRISLQAADNPLVFASPSSVGFGLMARHKSAKQVITITDAGGAVGACQAHIRRSESTSGASIRVPASVTVPGALSLVASTTSAAREGDLDGWVALTCAGRELKIPFWLHVSVPQLGKKTKTAITQAGIYQGDTKGKTALVDRYIYPERAAYVPAIMKGPEQVFRLSLKGSRQNFGVIVLSQAKGVAVTPRIVRSNNESRLAGLTALPVDVNPYTSDFGAVEPIAGVLRPGPGSYDIVFDTTSAAKAGRFRFHLWINDQTPPRIRMLSRKSNVVTALITDSGAGVDPRSILATSGSRTLTVSFASRTGEAKIDVTPLETGSTLVIRASDYQESKNDENAGALLPNTSEISFAVPAAPR